MKQLQCEELQHIEGPTLDNLFDLGGVGFLLGKALKFSGAQVAEEADDGLRHFL